MGSINLLLVEDSIDYRDDLEAELQGMGYVVDTAASFKDAYELAKNPEKKYDALFCDTDLDTPFENYFGIDVAKTFRKTYPNSIIVGMSSDKDFQSRWDNISNTFYKKSMDLKIDAEKLNELYVSMKK